jgi:hypothetical protein
MKWKHAVLALFPVFLASACSDDDDASNDVCKQACAALSSCSMEVPCGGVELSMSDCTAACNRQQAQGAARCVIGVGSCDIMKMNPCRVQMPCN